MWASNLFRPYLFGNSFTLVTDHEPLKWIMTTQKLTRNPARWSLLLQEYDFTVVHREGTDNANADCLSRYPRTSSDQAPVLDWEKGEIMLVATCLALSAQSTTELAKLEDKEIWLDVEVLNFLQTHQ